MNILGIGIEKTVLISDIGFAKSVFKSKRKKF